MIIIEFILECLAYFFVELIFQKLIVGCFKMFFKGYRFLFNSIAKFFK